MGLDGIKDAKAGDWLVVANTLNRLSFTGMKEMRVMGVRYQQWVSKNTTIPESFHQLADIVVRNRNFTRVESLQYGDHGLEAAFTIISRAIRQGKRIALYADYDVDGTMSCVSWIWFLRGIGYHNFTYYIPDRFKEGYGVNLAAVQYLAQEQQAEVIITMDTGITANQEAQWCRENQIEFICTDHHKIQPDKMPDCVILNPKTHPDPIYQELCGCGITFVLLRKLGKLFQLPIETWTDILALVGMATICDVVPLNGVNHNLARLGVKALLNSNRPVLQKLLAAASVNDLDETDVGFKLGPRINAVGRLEHAEQVIKAFVNEECDPLIFHMGTCNERRKTIQAQIVKEALAQAEAYRDDPILFLGGNWHQGVVGIAASKLVEEHWKPVWLFQQGGELCKGSARSIPGFDVTDAMSNCGDLFTKFGGHKAAGGFAFAPEQGEAIRRALIAYSSQIKSKHPEIWQSKISYDCILPPKLTKLELTDHLSHLRPYGHCFEEPLFCLEAKVKRVDFLRDKITKDLKHTSVSIPSALGGTQKILFFNQVYQQIEPEQEVRFLVTASKNTWQGNKSLSLIGSDFQII